ncbi:MAG: hypothetical protein IJD60_07455 [Clostridia bacterium]|nr:hypothetical protein [Clostridia bacterium]
MENPMSKLLTKNIAAVGVVTFGVATLLMLLTTLFICIGMMAGEWAVLHALAALGMTAGFAVLTACCMAVCEYHGNAFWKGDCKEK